ncbi:hypothetical protein ACC792_38130, partial [Rhizobium ruizarguesonis]
SAHQYLDFAYNCSTSSNEEFDIKATIRTTQTLWCDQSAGNLSMFNLPLHFLFADPQVLLVAPWSAG